MIMYGFMSSFRPAVGGEALYLNCNVLELDGLLAKSGRIAGV